jgi:hypothetical protein
VSTEPNPNIYNIEEHPSFRGMFDEVKDEFGTFVATRLNLLRTEMREKASSLKFGLPMIVAGSVLLLTSLVFLNVAILGLLALAFGATTLAWIYASAILFGCYAAIGGVCAFLGAREIKTTGIVPTHTISVLKQDQNWIQREAKTQL